MPELPEVEHARRTLNRWLRGRLLSRVTIADPRILEGDASPTKVVRALRGRTVEKVERRGKWLRLTLDRGFFFSHLGMTGKWVRLAAGAPVERFEKLRFEAVRGEEQAAVVYLDPRLFGRVVTSRDSLPVWDALGPDPLVDGIHAEALGSVLARRGGPIKPVLLDQTVLAGVGNIQATDALFFARIDPRRPARSLTAKEVGALGKAITKSIDRTLEMQKGPRITYVEEAGSENPFVVYGRGGEPCPRCRRPLTRMMLAGRGTVFCAHCQR